MLFFIDRLLSYVALGYVGFPLRSLTYDAAKRSRSFHRD